MPEKIGNQLYTIMGIISITISGARLSSCSAPYLEPDFEQGFERVSNVFRTETHVILPGPPQIFKIEFSRSLKRGVGAL